MIKISDKTYLAAHAIKSIRLVEPFEGGEGDLDYILVSTFDGENYQAQPDSWQTLTQKLDELVFAVRTDSGLEQ